ncbi:LPS export ABC transporter permease LptF [Tateyamaria omphalii]|uniref:LPS export ABC transporter permease LptF n=1 Tax=Tateyamaria omphalii TaxID=299262 RepID=A0A1P8MTC6_9RHOB|nr:LPS export ABC transporter permease LptF [Tateyamaria omphalii]APX11340.1 LPS export ABC transporter permease LptF [Tateyamaria omphalii]
MVRFDRYMLSQLMWLFGFFALVLVSVFWINRAVQLFDRLIGDGQTALVFLEFSALGLPRLITTVLPIATFAAAVYVTNRLNNESELTVMMSTGTSPWRLARPVAVFGLISALMMSVLSHILVPAASEQLTQREAEISRNVTSRLLTEGTFLSPTPGVTFYTRAIDEDGVLQDVFLADRRTPNERVIYTAAEAYLVRNADGTALIMVDGLAQRLATTDNRLSTAKFQDFSFDISPLMNGEDQIAPSLPFLRTHALLQGWDDIARALGTTPGAVAEEVHSRFARAAFCLVTALIGFATLLVGGYSRFGAWREVVIAFLLLIALDGMRSALSPPVLADARMWPILYTPSVLGLGLTAGLLWFASGGSARLRRLRGRTA